MILTQKDKNKIKELIDDKACTLINEIQDTDKLVDTLGLDSLDIVELAMDIENEFDITEITDDETTNLITVQDIFTLLEESR